MNLVKFLIEKSNYLGIILKFVFSEEIFELCTYHTVFAKHLQEYLPMKE